jgi:Protein of unknown function (DUF2924)
MDPSVNRVIEQLHSRRLPALKKKYREAFGEDPRSSNKQFLFRRLAWQLQANAEGGLSDRARHRAAEIADDADLGNRAPNRFSVSPAPIFTVPPIERSGAQRDWRLPAAGTFLTRRLGGEDIVVKVLEQGFEYQSRPYRTLSAIAREVTGTRWNGFLFFGLTERGNG